MLSAGGTNALPYEGTGDDRFTADLYIKGLSNEEVKSVYPMFGADVTTGFLETMKIPLLKGRSFDGRDTPDSPMVVIISKRAAEALWPGKDPIGQEVLWGVPGQGSENPYCRVIGVVGNVKRRSVEGDNVLNASTFLLCERKTGIAGPKGSLAATERP